MGYNGSAILAMAGKDCVAIACDRRYGVQVRGNAVEIFFGMVYLSRSCFRHKPWRQTERKYSRCTTSFTLDYPGWPLISLPFTRKLSSGLQCTSSERSSLFIWAILSCLTVSLQEREIKPAAFGKLVSTLLYEKRFGPYFIEPVIAGLTEVFEYSFFANHWKPHAE